MNPFVGSTHEIQTSQYWDHPFEALSGHILFQSKLVQSSYLSFVKK